MPLRSHFRAYLSSAVYAAALLSLSLLGPRLFAQTFVQLVICGALLALFVLFVCYRNEIAGFTVSVFRACADLLLCLIAAFGVEWLPVSDEIIFVEPYSTPLFQRPPPRLA
jgi:hypothetical protein